MNFCQFSLKLFNRQSSRGPREDNLTFAFLIILIALLCSTGGRAVAKPQFGGEKVHQVKLSVEEDRPGAPLTFGIPFPKGQLFSPNNVQIKDQAGKVIPSQITQVNTWEPADNGIQWIWVFIFSNGQGQYTLEYGEGIEHQTPKTDKITVSNHWVDGGRIRVNTGAMEFSLRKGIGGFVDEVKFDSEDVIAYSPDNGRGNFLDIVDGDDIDLSKAEITFVRADKGSGPLHTVLHIEGIYHYDHKQEAPFEMHLHAYAGQTYLRVLNTIVYTGQPTQHPLLKGQHAMIATADQDIINEDSLAGANDSRWTTPKDQIKQMGLSLNYHLQYPLQYKTTYQKGDWWEQGEEQSYKTALQRKDEIGILQTGDNPSRMPPLKVSASNVHQKGAFEALLTKKGDQKTAVGTKADGWIEISDSKQGIAVGVKNFFQEYPKELHVNAAEDVIHAFSWSPNVEPMSFARYSSSVVDGDEFDNFAQGVAKTTENVFYFFKKDNGARESKTVMDYFLDPPVAHAVPEQYAMSKVFGDLSVANEKHPAFQRSLAYKYQWMLYNQHWEPWYGMWDFGEMKNYFYADEWHQWGGNEPAQDFMWWLEFLRTGNKDLYRQAEASSRFSMDINQIHWPKNTEFTGDSNPALDYWKFKKDSLPGSPYVGMGRRHSTQHWISQLSAHVWTPGWITSYFVTGDNRSLEVAQLTGDHYLRRNWGEHGITGRRLYLSVWNLSWLYNATKDEKYGKELDFRVQKMLVLQGEQQGNLVRDRYDYAQAYASHGLDQYLNFTNKHPDKIKAALVENARRLQDVPPWGHEYESYLATIHPILMGYKYTGEKKFLETAIRRSEVLKMDALPRDIQEYSSQGSLEEALEKVSHLPKETEPYEQIENGIDKYDVEKASGEPIWKYSSGLRVFGWTHFFNLPWLLEYMD